MSSPLARPVLERQSSVDAALGEMQLPGLRDGELGMLQRAVRELGFDTTDTLADSDAESEITKDVLKKALSEAGAGLRAGSIAIKARKALAEKYGWSSTSASSPASSSVTSAEDKVARLEAELAEMKEKVSSVGHAADASVVAQLQKKVRELDGQRKGPGESSVGTGGLASAMLPASAKDGFSDEVSKDLQQVKKVLAQHDDNLRLLNERAAVEEEERGGRES